MAFAAFDDEPRVGTKPEPVKPPEKKKKGFNWGKLALVVLAVVAIVASVATFGLTATLAVAAIGTIAASATVGAVNGAKNNYDSQLGNYLLKGWVLEYLYYV